MRFAVRTDDLLGSELVSSVVLEAGASGIEERDAKCEESLIQDLWVYTDSRRAAAVREALAALSSHGVTLGDAEIVPDTDWSLEWRAGMRAIEISSRLVVAPSFLTVAARVGQALVTIDPGQAFGTGGHASTRLALALVAALPDDVLARARVADVGTGSGVLALAALALGAPWAAGFDLDPLAATAARENAARNGLSSRLRVFTGPIAALRADAGFSLVLANLLRTELLPICDAVADRVAEGGSLVLSGLLASEGAEVSGRLGSRGFALADERAETDTTGDTWLGLRLTR